MSEKNWLRLQIIMYPILTLFGYIFGYYFRGF
jgi:hypothetical protein